MLRVSRLTLHTTPRVTRGTRSERSDEWKRLRFYNRRMGGAAWQRGATAALANAKTAVPSWSRLDASTNAATVVVSFRIFESAAVCPCSLASAVRLHEANGAVTGDTASTTRSTAKNLERNRMATATPISRSSPGPEFPCAVALAVFPNKNSNISKSTGYSGKFHADSNVGTPKYDAHWCRF